MPSLAGQGHFVCHVRLSIYVLICHTQYLHLTNLAHGVLLVCLLFRLVLPATALADVGVPNSIG